MLSRYVKNIIQIIDERDEGRMTTTLHKGRLFWLGVLALFTAAARIHRSEEHTSELQSLMRNSYAVFCLKKKTPDTPNPRSARPGSWRASHRPSRACARSPAGRP